MSAAAVLTAAGSGSRLGLDVPKALVPVAGTPMVRWAASSLAAMCGRIVVTAPADAVADIASALAGVSARIDVVAGGATRQESVRRGLEALADLDDDDLVLVHDAARPFMPLAACGRVLTALEKADGAIPVVPVVDTVVRAEGASLSYLDRSTLGAVQTPQGFRMGVLRGAHARAAAEGVEATDDGSLVLRYGGSVATVQGDQDGAKITYPADLEACEKRMATR